CAPGELEDRGRNVHRADEAAARASGPNLSRESHDEGGRDAAVVESHLRARERRAVVAEQQDERRPGDAFPVELGKNAAHVIIQARDSPVVQRELAACLADIREKGWYDDIGEIVRRVAPDFVEGTVRVVRSQPEEEGLPPGAVPQRLDPMIAAAPVRVLEDSVEAARRVVSRWPF